MFDRKDHIKTQPLKTRSYPPSNFAISKIRVGVGLAVGLTCFIWGKLTVLSKKFVYF